MRQTKEEYLQILTEQIRCKKARSQVEKEIRSHLEELENTYLSEGRTKEEAEAEAVKEMGDPVEAGSALDLIHRPRMAWGFVALIGVLYIVGFIILLLLQIHFTNAMLLPGSRIRYIGYMLFGFAVLVGVCYLDYSRLGLWAKEIMILLLILLVVGIAGAGIKVNGAAVFINLPLAGVSVNTMMLCYLFLPLYGAVVYSYRGQGYGAVGKSLLWMLPVLAICLYVPSTSTFMMIFLMSVLILSFAVVRGWFAVSKKGVLAAIWGCVALLPLAGCLWFLRFGAGYQADRIRAMLNPAGGGNYSVRMLRAILDGSMLSGSGESAMNAADRLAGETEYGLAYVMAYYGILAAILLVGVLTALFAYFLGLSFRQKNELGMIMGVSCSVVFFVQLLFYVMGNMGIFDLGGFYCPFFTYGGTGTLVTNILLGILLSIYRYQEIPLEMEKQKKIPTAV